MSDDIVDKDESPPPNHEKSSEASKRSFPTRYLGWLLEGDNEQFAQKLQQVVSFAPGVFYDEKLEQKIKRLKSKRGLSPTS